MVATESYCNSSYTGVMGVCIMYKCIYDMCMRVCVIIYLQFKHIFKPIIIHQNFSDILPISTNFYQQLPLKSAAKKWLCHAARRDVARLALRCGRGAGQSSSPRSAVSASGSSCGSSGVLNGFRLLPC